MKIILKMMIKKSKKMNNFTINYNYCKIIDILLNIKKYI